MCLYSFLIFFVFFDSIRSNMILGGYLSFFREMCVLLIFIMVAIHNQGRVKLAVFNISIVLFYTYHIAVALISIPEFLTFNHKGLILVYRYFQFPMLLYSFFYFEKLTKKPFSVLYNKVVVFGVVFVLLSLTLFVVYVPIWEKFRPWYGRISVGYPTMDAISLCYALCIVLFCKGLNFNQVKRVFYILVLLLGIFLQVTGTGFAALAFIILYSGFVLRRKYFPSVHSISWRNAIIIISTLGLVALLYVAEVFPELYMKSMNVLQMKIETIIGAEDESVEDTMDIRKEQFEYAKRNFQDDILKKIFGIGFGRYNMEDHTDKKFVYVEDQYSSNIIAYGYVGFFLFMMIFVSMLYEIIKKMKNFPNQSILMFASLVVFAMNCKTLIPLYLYANAALFALMYASFKYKTSYQ